MNATHTNLALLADAASEAVDPVEHLAARALDRLREICSELGYGVLLAELNEVDQAEISEVLDSVTEAALDALVSLRDRTTPAETGAANRRLEVVRP